MKFRPAWGSHLPVLIKVMAATTGPVLELGSGVFSTPFLHWACYDNKRELVTYDSSPEYFEKLSSFAADFHKLILVEDWDAVDIDRAWDVVLVDHAPAARRVEEIKRLAQRAKYLVVHDTDIKGEREYHFSEIYPLFKYAYKYRRVKPHTTVLSNFEELSWL